MMHIHTNLDVHSPKDKRTIDIIESGTWILEDIEVYNNETVYLTLKGHYTPDVTWRKDFGQI